jgi:biotin carboxyl carrier protein
VQVATDWPGLVREVHVSVGDAVAEQQELFTLESMKMFQPILAPTAGQVTAIHVAVDDFVNPGTPLATIE